MSLGGPSPLGTLLVQRLDAVLGIALSKQSSLVADTRQEARPAVTQRAHDPSGTTSTPSAPTTLGQAARTILALVTAYPDQDASVQGRQPLLPAPAAAPAPAFAPSPASAPATGPGAANTPASATAASGGALPQLVAQLAAGLSQAVQGSGLFYEAHLAQLAYGKLSAAQLMREPQAQIGRPAAQASSDAPASGGPAASTQHTQSTQPPPNTQNTQGAQPPHIPGLDPQAHGLVRQQLDVLANQSFCWQGQAWPGADMHWEVSRQTNQEQDASEAAGHWATRLTLHLPGLGEVHARLNLAGRQLVMQLVSPHSAGLLDTHAEALRSRYAAQGLQLSRLSIMDQDAGQGATSSPQDEAS